MLFKFIRRRSCHLLPRSSHSYLSSLPEVLWCSSSQVSFHLLKFMFYSIHVQLECHLNSFILIPLPSCSNRSGFELILFRSFDSRQIHRFFSYSRVLNFVHPLSFVL